MPHTFIGRQPICDASLAVTGYELLYRTPGHGPACPLDGTGATATVAVAALVDIGYRRLVGGKSAWINLTPEFLTGAHYRSLPPETTVLELLEYVQPTPEVRAAILDARARGYTVVLDDFLIGSAQEALLDCVDGVKVETPGLDDACLRKHVEFLRAAGVRDVLAEKLQTWNDFKRCKAAGFDLFQGFFFCEPELVTTRRLPANRVVLLELLALLQDSTASFERVKELIEQDVSLGLRVMRFANSALIAPSRPIESIRHAAAMLGARRIRECAALLLLDGCNDKPTELLTTALVRARLCQELAAANGETEAARSFTVGLLSMLEALLDAPLADLLRPLALAEDVTAAIVRHEGTLGAVLSVALAVERCRFDELETTAFDLGSVQRCYVDALAWVEQAQVRQDGVLSGANAAR